MWGKVHTSVNVVSRKEKSDNKLALKKQNEKADTSISTNSEGELKKKTNQIDRDSSPNGSISVKKCLLNFS